MARIATNVLEQSGLMEMDMQPQSYLTNYTENSTTAVSQVFQTVFMSDDDMQVMGSPTDNRNEVERGDLQTGVHCLIGSLQVFHVLQTALSVL